jgi:catechol 2,3-dioxygenase-like lactoylglutathione lyase family enzyme
MKPNSISGLSYYVEDLARSTTFYEALGFRRGNEESDRVTFYVNWFFVTLVAQDSEEDPELRKDAKRTKKGAGVLLHVKVDDADSFHNAATAAGLEPAGEPLVRPSGNREFVIQDPDGYRLVFFQKK